MPSSSTSAKPKPKPKPKPIPPETRGSPEYDEHIKRAANEYCILERMFYQRLSDADLIRLGDSPNQPTHRLVYVHRHHVRIMLMLKEVNPCAVINDEPRAVVNHDCHDIITRKVEECLKLVIEKYSLEHYGFHLQQITHPLPSCIGQLEHAWIFCNARSEEFPDIVELFFQPRGTLTEHGIPRMILGSPSIAYPGDINMVIIKDATEHKRLATMLGGSKQNFVFGWGYCCGDIPKDKMFDAISIVDEHFGRCARAARSVGWELELKLDCEEALGFAIREMSKILD